MEHINVYCDGGKIELFFRMTNSKKELYISCDGIETLFKQYCLNVWNDIMKRRQEKGESVMAEKVAVEFSSEIYKVISLIPESVCLTNPSARALRNGIADTSISFLELCGKLMDKQKKRKGANGVYPVAYNCEKDKVLCIHCFEIPKKKLFCSKCKRTCYCSAECQKSDWKNHKKICCYPAGDEAGNEA